MTYSKFLKKKYQEQHGKCAISGVPLILETYKNSSIQTASLDRIDSSKGYTLENTQWIHKDLQWLKGTFTQSEFLSWVLIIADFQRGVTTKVEAPITAKSSRWMAQQSKKQAPALMAQGPVTGKPTVT